MIKFEVDNSNKYNIEVILNSAIYLKMLKICYLLRIYYLIISNSYQKEENT